MSKKRKIALRICEGNIREIDKEIFSKIKDDITLLSICYVNKYFNSVTENNQFWRMRWIWKYKVSLGDFRIDRSEKNEVDFINYKCKYFHINNYNEKDKITYSKEYLKSFQYTEDGYSKDGHDLYREYFINTSCRNCIIQKNKNYKDLLGWAIEEENIPFLDYLIDIYKVELLNDKPFIIDLFTHISLYRIYSYIFYKVIFGHFIGQVDFMFNKRIWKCLNKGSYNDIYKDHIKIFADLINRLVYLCNYFKGEELAKFTNIIVKNIGKVLIKTISRFNWHCTYNLYYIRHIIKKCIDANIFNRYNILNLSIFKGNLEIVRYIVEELRVPVSDHIFENFQNNTLISTYYVDSFNMMKYIKERFYNNMGYRLNIQIIKFNDVNGENVKGINISDDYIYYWINNSDCNVPIGFSTITDILSGLIGSNSDKLIVINKIIVNIVISEIFREFIDINFYYHWLISEAVGFNKLDVLKYLVEGPLGQLVTIKTHDQAITLATDYNFPDIINYLKSV